MSIAQPSGSPRPSVVVTILGWMMVVAGAILSIISFFSLLMIIVGSYGTNTADVPGFLLVVVAPPFTLVAGIGMLRRRRWAWLCLVAGLGCFLLVSLFEFTRPPEPAVRTHVSPSGVKTTEYHSGPQFSVPTIVLCAGLLIYVWMPGVRREFGWSRRKQPSPASATRPGSQPPKLPDKARGWRVGHAGRDRMYYEEWREDGWRRINLSGEMLTGPAHHVIYFPSPQAWRELPEWARDRRDEILARIKSEFREPEYEYALDVNTTAGGTDRPVLAATNPARPSRCTARQMGAVILCVGIFLVLAGYLGWLVKGGWEAKQVTLPSAKATQRRAVPRETEPALYWFSLGLYAAAAAGSLGFAAWMTVQGWKTCRSQSSPP
ncbi:MAG: hypothetical protein H7A52_09590 [Akkermansiaceae bacterium]|nr:hypothetical protein [Akkermansiaceae bacterium]